MSFYLPPLVTFQSNSSSKYSVYNDAGIRFAGESLFSKLAKFQVIQATIGGGFVHIKSMYNKKFLRRQTATAGSIYAAGDEMDENSSSGTCTLFKPQLVDSAAGTFQLIHVQSGKPLSGTATSWVPSTTTTGSSLLFTAIDLESLIILPRHVAFKGSNGKYLRAHTHTDGKRYLMFDTTDKGHADSWFEVFTTGDQRIYVRQHSTQSSWTHTVSDGFIYSHVSYNDVTFGSKFVPAKIDGSTIGIRAHNLFFNPVTKSGVGDCLKAASSSLTASTRMGVEELVLERRVYDANFDLTNATIYDETPLVMATQTANNTSDESNTMELKFTYTDSKSSTWTSTNSWMVGVTVSASFKIPFIGGGGVEATTEFSGSYEWGETQTTTTTMESTYTAVVPARTNIKVSLIATQGKCDVDYSFYQRDRLYDGTSVIFYKEDGLYTGINTFNFQYEVTSTTLGRSGEEKVEIIPITPPADVPSATPMDDVPAPKPIPKDPTQAMLLPLEVVDPEI